MFSGILAGFIFALVITGCGPVSGPDADVVEWPELKELDIPSAKAEGFAKKEQPQALRDYLPELIAAAAAVTAATRRSTEAPTPVVTP